MGRGVRISVETRDEILTRLKNGERSVDLALEYGLSKQTIGRMSRRFAGRIFKSPPLPRAPKVGSVPVSEFVEVGYSGLADSMLAEKPAAQKLEISVKSPVCVLTFDGTISTEQLGLIFKLIGSLC